MHDVMVCEQGIYLKGVILPDNVRGNNFHCELLRLIVLGDVICI